MSAQAPQPSPELFFQTLNAYQRTAAIKAALELEVFTALGEGKQTAQEIAARCQTSERGMRILFRHLKHVRPVERGHQRIRVLLRNTDPEYPVPGGDVEHF